MQLPTVSKLYVDYCHMMHFTQVQYMLPQFSLSIHLSVTFNSCIQTAERIEVIYLFQTRVWVHMKRFQFQPHNVVIGFNTGCQPLWHSLPL